MGEAYVRGILDDRNPEIYVLLPVEGKVCQLWNNEIAREFGIR